MYEGSHEGQCWCHRIPGDIFARILVFIEDIARFDSATSNGLIFQFNSFCIENVHNLPQHIKPEFFKL